MINLKIPRGKTWSAIFEFNFVTNFNKFSAKTLQNENCWKRKFLIEPSFQNLRDDKSWVSKEIFLLFPSEILDIDF